MPVDIDRIIEESSSDPSERAATTAALMGIDLHSDEPPNPAEHLEDDQPCEQPALTGRVARLPWRHILAYGLLPALAMTLALGAGYLKWHSGTTRQSQAAATQSVRAATDSMIAMLTYRPDTVDKELPAARDRMTGKFRDEYTQLINTVVIPGAKQKQISATATVPAAASISANESHAVVVVFVDQSVAVGVDPPTNMTSSALVTLEKVRGRWLISHFEPI
jgi:Mce-associated membrane protein